MLDNDYHPSMHNLDLETAVGEIHQACESRTGKQSPFFLIVGAGISAPALPMASEIEEECKTIALRHKRTTEPAGKCPIDTYSHWFSAAYPHAHLRQEYLRQKMQEKPISSATFRLAHLLLEKTIGNVVVTPNFDDFLSRALSLFGAHPIVCDHPNTIGRINGDSDDIQIVHVHGTYWSYDCCNLRDEIEKRETSGTGPLSIPAFLNSLLWNRSPIVVGYSGWEGDVIMSALKRRLLMGTRFDLYWFCYKRSAYDLLPDWLKLNSNIRFVLPKLEAEQERLLDPSTRRHANIPEALSLKSSTGTSQTLPAQKVFDHLVRSFELQPPLFTSNPLQFFVAQLKNSIFLETEGQSEQDIFSLGNVIARVQRAADQAEEEAKKASVIDTLLEQIRDATRRSAYQEAIRNASGIESAMASDKQKEELIHLVISASVGLADGSPDELAGCKLVCVIAEDLEARCALSRVSAFAWAEALVNKGICLGVWQNNNEEAIAAYDEVDRRFGDSTEIFLRETVVRALVNKGFALSALRRSEEAIAVCDEVMRRFGNSTGAVLHEYVARALVNKGSVLGAARRSEEAIAVYDEVVRRFGDSTETFLREAVVRALINKGVALGVLQRNEEAIAVCDEVVRRFGDSTEIIILREAVVRALFNKGVALGVLQRNEEAIAVYDEVVRRFGGSAEAALREHMARVLINKGVALYALQRTEELIVVCEEVARRFGDSPEAALREFVARALLTKGIAFGALQRSEDALAVYDEVIRRFGSVDELKLRKLASEALLQKAIVLKNLGKTDQVTSTIDDFDRLFEKDLDFEIEEWRKQVSELGICQLR